MNTKRRLKQCRFLATTAMLLLPTLGQAVNITVNTTNDLGASSGDCGLRDAISAANSDTAVDNCVAGSGQDTITLPAGTYTLTDSDLIISSELTIDGAGATSTIVEGEPGTDGPVGDETFSCCRTIFNISVSGFATINGITIQKGMNAEAGGIFNQGVLTVNDSIIQHNYAPFVNSADTGGGGIKNAANGVLTLNNTTVRDNVAFIQGGGIAHSGTLLTLNNSTVSNNLVMDEGVGGGIYSSELLYINNSTLSANTGGFGGALFIDDGTTRLSNVTIVNNEAADDGSGDFGYGGGIFIDSAASVRIGNSIMAMNTGVNAPGCFGVFASSGYNIISDCPVLLSESDLRDVDPMLGVLANNGGATQTHALLTGSPAIEGGDPNGCVNHNDVELTTDQRGQARVQDFDEDGSAICDIGAYEAAALIEPLAGAIDTVDVVAQSANGNGSIGYLFSLLMGSVVFGLRRLNKTTRC